MEQKENLWFVYIIACEDNTLYTGITNNLEKRLTVHQSGKGARYTKSHGAKEIVYSKLFNSRSTATKQEVVLKKLTRSQKFALINEFRNSLTKSH